MRPRKFKEKPVPQSRKALRVDCSGMPWFPEFLNFQPKVISETITDDSIKEPRRLDPIPQCHISCEQTISAAGWFSRPAG
jgi:hypothetical protein